MAELGRQIEKAHKLAAPALAGLAIMLTRGKGNKTKIAGYSDDLEQAAKILREAIGVE